MTKTNSTEAPLGYDPSQFPPFAVTVDIVILTMSAGTLNVLLVRRGEAPFKGMWAVPGGFKRPTETLDGAALRELREETGVDAASLLKQFGAYGDPGRDPRMNVVTVAYLAVIRDVGALVAGHRCSRSCARTCLGRPQRAARAGVRPPAHRARCDRARARRARGLRHRDCFRGADVHDGRAPRRLRGHLGRAARRRELPAQHRRRGRLGDPDRAPGTARVGRRQACRALSSGTGVEARRADPSFEPKRGNEHESCRA